MKALIEFDEYISPAPESQVFNLHDAHVYFIMSGTGRGMPPIDYITERGPLQHGESLIDYRLRPRLITMVTRRRFPCRQGYWEGRNDLLDALRPNRQAIGQFNPGILRKILPDGSMRDIEVMIESGPAFEPRALDRWDERAFSEILRFVAHDPTFYDPVTQAEQWVLVIEDNLIFGCVPDLEVQQVYDTFTDPNGTSLDAHAPDVDVVGPGWTELSGNWDIQGNEAREATGGGGYAIIDTGISDGIVEADVRIGAAASIAEILFRYKDADEFWTAELNDNLQRITLWENTPGGWQSRAWVAFAQDENTWYNIKVVLAGPSIRVYVDNVFQLSYESASLQTETDAGLGAWAVLTRFDNFQARIGWPCDDPYPDRLVFPIWFTGTLISAYLNLTYLGTWLSYPTIVVTGPADNLLIRNVTTNEKLELVGYNIGAGEVVTFVTEYGNKTVTNQVGDNLLPYLTTDSDLATFHLEPDPGAPGGVNQMYVYASNASPATQVVIYWQTRFIGI